MLPLASVSFSSWIVPSDWFDAPERSWKWKVCPAAGGWPLTVLCTFARPKTLQLALAGLVWMTLLSPYLDASVAVALTVLLTEPAPAGTVFVTGKVVLPPAAAEHGLFAPSSGSVASSASRGLWSVAAYAAGRPRGAGCA